MRRFVLVSDAFGVYVGSFLGLGFWSRLDAAGQTSAVTFETPFAAAEFGDAAGLADDDLRAVEVEVAHPSGAYATREECAAAGVRWEP